MNPQPRPLEPRVWANTLELQLGGAGSIREGELEQGVLVLA